MTSQRLLPRLLAGLPADGSALSLAEHLVLHGPPSTQSGPELLAAVKASGLRGRGGAGFPTSRKMSSVASARSVRAPIVVANGAEGEPASGKDRLLLFCAPHLVLDGIAAAAAAVGAARAVLCLHEGTPVAEPVRRALAERRAAGTDRHPVEVVTVPARYVASEESSLVNWLTRGRALPTTRPPRPDQRGVDGRPTLINNVETLAHLALIDRHGPRWFTEIGTPAEPGSVLLTVHGAVAAPGILEVESGTMLTDVLAMCGGLSEPVSGYLIGGYFGAWFAPDNVSGLPLTHAGLSAVGGAMGAGVILALPANVCPLRETGRVLRWLADQSAGQCGPCQFGLPAISGAFEQLIRGKLNQAGRTRLHRWIGDVQGRGACHHPDGTARFVSTALAVFRVETDLHARGRCCAPGSQPPVCPLPEDATMSPARLR
jgi:NADH:ubiquinone oxidoreductase subunit F (NADH-binding)